MDKTQSSKPCQIGVKRTCFQNLKEKGNDFFDHSTTLKIELKKSFWDPPLRILPQYHQYIIYAFWLFSFFIAFANLTTFKRTAIAEKFYWEQGLKKTQLLVCPFNDVVDIHLAWSFAHQVSENEKLLARREIYCPRQLDSTFSEPWRVFRNRPSVLVNSHVSKKGKKVGSPFPLSIACPCTYNCISVYIVFPSQLIMPVLQPWTNCAGKCAKTWESNPNTCTYEISVSTLPFPLSMLENGKM